MKFFVQHPYKERIELNIGAITQIVGQNKELKYYIWQILSWYFGGKKYSSEDLSIFDYEEPTILDETGEIVKRSSYHYIDISSFKDLLEQMEYKKGTLAQGYLSKIVNQVDVVAYLEKINEQVELIEGAINQHINLNSGQVEYHLENQPLTLDQLLSKNFSPFFAIENKNLSFEWVSNTDKLFLFLDRRAADRCQRAVQQKASDQNKGRDDTAGWGKHAAQLAHHVKELEQQHIRI